LAWRPGGRYHEYVAKPSIVKKGAQFVYHVVPQVIRPLQSLWNEVIGFLFLSLAFLGSVSGYRIARRFDGSPETFFRLSLVILFVLIMFFYGVSSFRRARKISRS
jgi:hypothetical protein